MWTLTDSIQQNLRQFKFDPKTPAAYTREIKKTFVPPLPLSSPPHDKNDDVVEEATSLALLCDTSKNASPVIDVLTAGLSETVRVDCTPSSTSNFNDVDVPISDACSSTRIVSNSPSHLRYERKSPTRHVLGDGESIAARNYLDELPWLAMHSIFDNLELRDRVRASMVCRRWHRILTDALFPLDDVVVMNIFERDVWEGSLSNNTGSKFQCARIARFSQFERVLAHCRTATSVKIWYFTTAFARVVLEILRKCNVQMRCLDIYPYSEHVGVELVPCYLPELRGLTMRPHGQDHFFHGLDLGSFPEFAQLETLNIDCINLNEETRLPESLTTLEWQSRNDEEFRRFLPKLSRLPRLQFLLLGHANFQGHEDFAEFLRLIHIDRMPSLQYLIFKFVKIDNLCYDEIKSRVTVPLERLQFLKFDLCYGDLDHMLDVFLCITSKQLRILSLNLLSDEDVVDGGFRVALFDALARRLHRRRVALHLGFLQRDSSGTAAAKRAQRRIFGAGAAPCQCVGESCQCQDYQRACPSQELQVSRYFELVLGKFEASFVSDASLLATIFGASSAQRFVALTELKFIQCDALTDELLGCIAMCCPQLRKLSLLSCSRCDEAGIRQFVELFHQRTSSTLKIIWKRDRQKFMRPSNFFLNLINEYKHLLHGLKYRFMCKTFGEGNNGEAIIIWQDQKRLFIQDFDEFDRNRILGFVLPNYCNDEHAERKNPVEILL